MATQVNHEVSYYDSRAAVLMVNGAQVFLPDGRVRYDALGAVPGKTSVNPNNTNRDVIVGNTSKGHSYTAAVSVSKSWDWGGDMSVAYARQQLKDTGAGVYFGTTAGSLYGGVMAGLDPNKDYLGRSVYEIPNRFKFSFGYHHAFFGDNETRINLFAERQDGRPFGFAMSDNSSSSRGPVFGVNRSAQLLYVPDFSTASGLDAGIVRFATQLDADNFKRYVTNFHLPTNGLVQKYSNTNPAINRVDMQLSQEFPGLMTGHKVQLQFDVRNLLNLVNSDWGRVTEYGDIQTLARVDCADAAGSAVTSTNASCARYRYSNVPLKVEKTVNSQASLWYVQIGLRYKF